MSYDQVHQEPRDADVLTHERAVSPDSRASTAHIVAMLQDFSRATREHFRTEERGTR